MAVSFDGVGECLVLAATFGTVSMEGGRMGKTDSEGVLGKADSEGIMVKAASADETEKVARVVKIPNMESLVEVEGLARMANAVSRNTAVNWIDLAEERAA